MAKAHGGAGNITVIKKIGIKHFAGFILDANT
jgi:hypothetical protein